MGKGRLEAFSDGVIAIIITIMVLELKVPHGGELADLLPLWPVFLSYVLSFVFVAIYWVNHHHFIHAFKHVTGGILWSNMLLLFCLSLIPFSTAWMGENHFTTWPIVVYGLNLLMCAIAYTVFAYVAVAAHGPDSAIAKALGKDWKGKASLAAYVAALPLAFYWPAASFALFGLVSLMWFVPDKRVERALGLRE